MLCSTLLIQFNVTYILPNLLLDIIIDYLQNTVVEVYISDILLYYIHKSFSYLDAVNKPINLVCENEIFVNVNIVVI